MTTLEIVMITVAAITTLCFIIAVIFIKILARENAKSIEYLCSALNTAREHTQQAIEGRDSAKRTIVRLHKQLEDLKRVETAVNQTPAFSDSGVQLTLPGYIVAMDFLVYAQAHPEQRDPAMLWSAFFEQCRQRTISGRENRG